jgi:uncharacterized membrane protein
MRVEKNPVLPVTATIAMALASTLCLTMVDVRIRYSGELFYGFMGWNLFLAWIPLGLALLCRWAAFSGRRRTSLALSALWLLFFPNAPYLLSDFVHLGHRTPVPLWWDGLMLAAFAGTGLGLGLLSLDLIRSAWQELAGRTLSWLGVLTALALSSVGVFLGRVFRFNSWDAFIHPLRIGRVLARFVEHRERLRTTSLGLAALTLALISAYAVFCGVARSRTEWAPVPPDRPMR